MEALLDAADQARCLPAGCHPYPASAPAPALKPYPRPQPYPNLALSLPTPPTLPPTRPHPGPTQAGASLSFVVVMPRWQMPRGPHLAVWRRVHDSPHATVQIVLPKVPPTHPTHPTPPTHPNPPTHLRSNFGPSFTLPPPPAPVQARHSYLEVGLTRSNPSRYRREP